MAKRPACPNCGRPLTPVTGDDPQTCPWLCQTCTRGFWKAELAAAKDWDPETRDFGGRTAAVLAACDQELAAALDAGGITGEAGII